RRAAGDQHRLRDLRHRANATGWRAPRGANDPPGLADPERAAGHRREERFVARVLEDGAVAARAEVAAQLHRARAFGDAGQRGAAERTPAAADLAFEADGQ